MERRRALGEGGEDEDEDGEFTLPGGWDVDRGAQHVDIQSTPLHMAGSYDGGGSGGGGDGGAGISMDGPPILVRLWKRGLGKLAAGVQEPRVFGAMTEALSHFAV